MSVMPVDHCPALAPHEAATPARVAVIGSVTGPAGARQTGAVARAFRPIAGFFGSTAVAGGAVLAAAATVLAIQLDAPEPIALVAGYVTLAATAGICAARLAARYSAPAAHAAGRTAAPESRTEHRAPEPIPESFPRPSLPLAVNDGDDQATVSAAPASPIPSSMGAPDAGIGARDDAARDSRGDRTERETRRRSDVDDAAWKRIDRLRVADAARLWCGLTPGHHATAEVMTWASAILDAIERGELAKSESSGILAQYKNGWHTEIHRTALQAWAASNGHAPRFLQD